MNPSIKSESDLWSQHVSDLKKAIELRKPDALQRLKLEVGRLDNEISTIVLRRAFVAGAGAWGLFDHLTEQLNVLLRRMKDMEKIGRGVKASLLDHDYGLTPEQASRAVIKGAEYKTADPGIDDLNDELKRAATDIHSGWSIITRGAAVTVSGKSPGSGDIGGKSAKLAEQYYWFVKELHRKHMGTWVFDDVVCNGLSRSECANKRRCYPTKVYDELVSGLQLYADTYPPL